MPTLGWIIIALFASVAVFFILPTRKRSPYQSSKRTNVDPSWGWPFWSGKDE